MRRFLTTLLFLLLAVQAVAGIPTVGPANSTADFKQLPGEGPQDTLRRCLNIHGVAWFLPGTYQFTNELSGAFNNVKIMGMPGAILKPVASGSVGLFDLSGTNIQIDGIKIQVDTFVDSQAVIKLTGRYPRVTNCLIDVTTSSGNTTTPMNLIEVTQCLEPVITDNLVHPNKGIRVLNVTEGHGGTFSRNRIRNETNEGIGGAAELPAEDTDYRLLYRGFQFNGAQWFSCEDNLFWNLGTTGAGNTVNRVIYYNKTTTISSSEEAHFSIRRNRVEAVACEANAVMVAGAQWFVIDENQLGWAKGVPNELTDAAIWIGARITDDALSESADAADASTQGTIRNNQIHNFAASHTPPVDLTDDSLAAGIYFSRCKRLQIHDNNITLCFGYAGMIANSTTSTDLSFQGNYIVSNDITAEWGIAFFGTVGGNYRFSDNVAVDMWSSGTSGVIQTTLTSATANTTGLTNAVSGSIFRTSAVGTLPAATTVTSNSVITRASGSFVTDGFQAGDLVITAGLDTAAENGRVYRVATVAALVLTLSGTPLTDDADAGNDVVVTKVGGLATSNIAQT